MDEVWQEFAAEAVDWPMLVRITIKLAVACACGSIIGLNREHAGENAGLAHAHPGDPGGGRVRDVDEGIRGRRGRADPCGAGRGDRRRLSGAGVILRLTDSVRVRGLTTAASIWLTAAVGCAVGAGRIWMPLVATLFAWITLAWLRLLEHHIVGSPAEHDA